jgi:hypothetical protein
MNGTTIKIWYVDKNFLNCLSIHYEMIYFSSMLAVPVFRSIIGKAFLTRRCSGLTHTAASTAELIR